MAQADVLHEQINHALITTVNQLVNHASQMLRVQIQRVFPFENFNIIRATHDTKIRPHETCSGQIVDASKCPI